MSSAGVADLSCRWSRPVAGLGEQMAQEAVKEWGSFMAKLLAKPAWS